MPMHTEQNKKIYEENILGKGQQFQFIATRGIVSTDFNKDNHCDMTLMNETFIHRSFVAYFFFLTIHFQFRLMFRIDDINETHYFHIVIGEDGTVFCSTEFRNTNDNDAKYF